MTDRLSLANALAEAKIERSAAERIATEIFEAIHDSVATKQDLEHLESALRSDLQRLEAATKADSDRLQAAMRELELRVVARIDPVVVRLGSPIVILAGIILAAIRYLPPAH